LCALVGFYQGALRFAGKEQNVRIQEIPMLNTLTPTPPRVIEVLARMRAEWQNAAAGASLLETEGNVGLILADIVNCLGLNADEQARVLGQPLFNEVRDLLTLSVTN
jgi:hypothetical protein